MAVATPVAGPVRGRSGSQPQTDSRSTRPARQQPRPGPEAAGRSSPWQPAAVSDLSAVPCHLSPLIGVRLNLIEVAEDAIEIARVLNEIQHRLREGIVH